MQVKGAETIWLGRFVAALFAIIVVLGLSAVVLTFVLYFPGSGSNIPLP